MRLVAAASQRRTAGSTSGESILAHARMIGVEPGDLFGVEQLRSISERSIGASVRVSNPYISRSAPAIALGSTTTRFSILMPQCAGVIIARLVGQDHARLQRRRTELRDALRPLVHGEIGADAMPRAVVEIEPGAPQRQPRQRVDLRAGRALRKHRAGDRDMAFEHAGEAVAHLVGGRPDREGARDVGRAVFILAAGIDEEDAFDDSRIALFRHAIVRNGGVGAGRDDRGKGDILQFAGLAPEGFERLGRVDLGELSARRI